jgi:uncharacterized repeat protein (TIGR01451 family)
MSATRPSTDDPSTRGPDPGERRSAHGRGVRAGLAAILALMAMAIAAPAASAQATGSWPCDAYGYLFQTRANASDSEIVQVDLATGAQTTIANTQSPTPGTHSVNAVGYNAVDEYFYGMRGILNPVTQVYSWSLVRVQSDGSLDELGVPTGPGGTMNALGSYPIGEVDLNGHYWAIDAVTSTWYEVDLTTPTPTVLRSGARTLPPGITGVGNDWSAIDGALYSFGSDAAGAAHLVRFDPDATPTFSDLGTIAAPGGFGASFADASGYLYGSQNATGDIYRIDPTTRQTILASDEGEVSPGNDGARCANAVVPTITVTKTVSGRVRPADQFTVGLLRPNGSAATSATTAGSATTASTVNFPASQGQTYTITDAMAPNSPTPLGEYVKSIACIDSDGNAVATGGSGPTWTLAVANATYYTCNVTNQAVADLELVKTAAPSPVVPGEDVTFSLTVTNKGPSTAIGQTVTDKLPAEVTFSSASPGCSDAGGTVTCAVGELASGASQTFTITGQVASSLDTCLENTATVAGPAFDPVTSNNSSTICTPIEGRSNVSISKAASTTTVAAGGGQVMYTLVVENEGPSDDPGVQVTDAMPAGLALVAANPSQGTCTTTNNTVACDLGTLKDRGSAQVLVTANTHGTAGCLTNTARVRGAHEDPDPANNQASAQVCVPPPPTSPPATFDLDVEKRASVSRPVVGQPVRYRIVVTNNGPDATPNAKVTDTFNNRATVVSVRTTAGSCTKAIPITCELGTIASGASVRITVVIKPREKGRARNAASATGEGNDSTPDNNMGTADVRVRKVALRVSKVASNSSVQAGGTLSYRIRVRNPSKGEARRVKVCDRLPSGLSFVSSTPRAKRSGSQRCWTIKRLKAGKRRTFRVTVRAARGANGRKVNRATLRSPDIKPAVARRPVVVRGARPGVTG